ncbi:hypothetical protein C449_06800 [Halococcus saccharolyticus DSM 5350]|uniref:DUF7573 domain-containing protein n=1 Tax=Halococcus saccharolyticus DSM 5350 TaxID=1227455 RepID=M0MIY1_9EURY|nr:hypothetical protein C449_06800 [Halococcus saccharolyticus DSM 5350]
MCVSVHHSQAVGAPTGDMADDAGPNDDTAADRATEPEPSATATSARSSNAENSFQSTYAWSPDEASCAECGGSVAARWRDDGDLVCAACKSW